MTQALYAHMNNKTIIKRKENCHHKHWHGSSTQVQQCKNFGRKNQQVFGADKGVK
jgi:hypothetical protein